MLNKTRIVIVGIGGVGGYFGGLVSKRYANGNDVEVVFVARGEHLNEIQNKGLTVINGNESFITKPHLATDDYSKIGVADYIIICTKSYDLKQTIGQLKPLIGHNTILLPLLNGVSASDEILEILPQAKVLKGCAFIVSKIKSPGIIENSGNIQKLSFGVDGPLNGEVLHLKNLMFDAGIDVAVSDKISTAIWEKFIFISPTATSTSYFDSTIGKVLEENLETVLKLIEEVKSLALAKGVTISDDISGKTLNTMKSMPYEVTSSMHRDYLNQKPLTEVESLTGYIVREAEKFGIAAPTYLKLYEGLLKE
ncbi:ketopantoate reductase family protein [Pedobacter sp. D749]|uniref:ketopantoate reductase family protein n=1 Tax=Pedobacter sp. D749 TaxID=2856523 RepID=UPI001C59EC16|nr:2-dehydropantoate 2-reductase [Pedobacter sp. D749]QXU41242.1 2-dehydropantoate 2-reductase [Pedobacter sp. D749]